MEEGIESTEIAPGTDLEEDILYMLNLLLKNFTIKALICFRERFCAVMAALRMGTHCPCFPP
jgi:hypothetical protein